MITIKQKESNSGSIYDIASDQQDRTINMDGYQYTVVLPSYYGDQATRHRSAGAATKEYTRQSDFYPAILDATGAEVIPDEWHPTRLIKKG